MPCHCHRGFAMALMFLQPVIELNHMLAGIPVAMEQNGIGGFH